MDKKIAHEQKVNETIRLILNEGVNMQRMRHELSLCGIKVTEKHARRLYKEATDIIRERFSKDLENQYEFIREQFLRLFNEAIHTEDRQLQRNLLKDLMKLAGLEEQIVNVQFKAEDDTLEAFNKMFE